MSIILPERTEQIKHNSYGYDDVDASTSSREPVGKVFLVGAGPGDAELITLKGLRCLRRADVVIYDRLICPELLDEVPPTALRVFAGKEAGHHAVPQEEINNLLVHYALQGLCVVRLKGGDPFVFGRGGEEALALAKENIPFEIVPGISSAVAVPAYAGIPVTHRGLSSSILIVTGHKERGETTSTVNWEAASLLVSSGGTLVILMGVETLPETIKKLIEYTLSLDTPVAVIQQGTVPRQRVVTATLAHIVEHVHEADLKSPAIIVVGAVVSLGETLSWYETAYSSIAQTMH